MFGNQLSGESILEIGSIGGKRPLHEHLAHCAAADLCPLGLSVELLSALLALPPLFPPSGRLSAELSSSFLVFSPFSLTTTRTTTRSLRFGVFSVCQPSYRLLFSRSLSPLPSFWSSVSRAIVFFSRFLPFLPDDDKDHDDITKVRRLPSLSAELSSALLALSPLFPPSGRLSAELSSSSLAFSPFSPRRQRPRRHHQGSPLRGLVCVILLYMRQTLHLLQTCQGMHFSCFFMLDAGGTWGVEGSGANEDTFPSPVISVLDAELTYLQNAGAPVPARLANLTVPHIWQLYSISLKPYVGREPPGWV